MWETILKICTWRTSRFHANKVEVCIACNIIPALLVSVSIVKLGAVLCDLTGWLAWIPPFKVEGTAVWPPPGALFALICCPDPNLCFPNIPQKVLLDILACHRCQMASLTFTIVLSISPVLFFISHPQVAFPFKLLPPFGTGWHAFAVTILVSRAAS